MRSLSFLLVLLVVASACVPRIPAGPRPAELPAQRAPGSAAAAAKPLAPAAIDVPQSTGDAAAKTVKVALLLPLSGRNAELGKAMQNAAAVSLFDKYARLSPVQQGTRVELLPIDSGDSSEMARRGMSQALAAGASLVIGPVFGDATEAAAPLAAAKQVPVLSFSNNRARSLPAGTYLMGFSPAEQVGRVVRYAITRDKKRIAVLVPRSPLGDEVVNAAQQEAKAHGKVSIIVAQYDAQGSGMDAAVAKLVPASGGAPAFDALLLAETGSPLQALLRTLSARGINGSTTQLLGTGMWDDAGLLASVNLDGAWLVSSAPDATARFEARFRSTYDYTPPRLSSLSYDAVALAITLATSGRPFTAESLTNPRGFVGPANGMFRLREAGTAERGLAVLQVRGGNLEVISPAPSEFSQ